MYDKEKMKNCKNLDITNPVTVQCSKRKDKQKCAKTQMWEEFERECVWIKGLYKEHVWHEKNKKQKKQQPLRDVKSNDEKGVYKTRVT